MISPIRRTWDALLLREVRLAGSAARRAALATGMVLRSHAAVLTVMVAAAGSSLAACAALFTAAIVTRVGGAGFFGGLDTPRARLHASVTSPPVAVSYASLEMGSDVFA